MTKVQHAFILIYTHSRANPPAETQTQLVGYAYIPNYHKHTQYDTHKMQYDIPCRCVALCEIQPYSVNDNLTRK